MLDPDYTFTNAYGLRWNAENETACPATFVIDTNRKVVFAKVSKTHGDRAEVADVLDALAGKAQASRRPRDGADNGHETAYFAGGCFWGIEHYFQKGPGVIDASSGYMQGHTDRPTYDDIVTEATGHAETVKVVFDPKRITYRRLLEAFFDMHDPTQLNRQGVDVGEQYRSGIYFVGKRQKQEAEAYIKELEASGRFGKRIVTQVEAAKTFFPAEEDHQDYVQKTGQACHVRNPW